MDWMHLSFSLDRCFFSHFLNLFPPFASLNHLKIQEVKLKNIYYVHIQKNKDALGLEMLVTLE